MLIDGQRIHFVHVRSTQPDAVPLILTHGWPNSFVEYLGLVGALTEPAAHGNAGAPAFHVVIPSLPGFGFSGPTREHGWSAQRTAAAWAEISRTLQPFVGPDGFAAPSEGLIVAGVA